MHEFFDESFDLENTFEDILSIQVSLNGFSFSIVRPAESKVLAFKQTPLKISSNNLVARRFKEWYQSEEILQKPFQKIRVILFSEKFTLVPDILYSNALKEEVAHVLFDKGNRLNFAENHLRHLGAKLLFALPEGLMKTINETLGDCAIIHPLKTVLNNLPEKDVSDQLVLLFNDKHLYITLQNNSQVKLANSFKINHANDVVYFVLTALKQLGVSSKNTALFYAGKSNYIGETEKNLQKHFVSTEKLAPPETQISKELVTENISLFL